MVFVAEKSINGVIYKKASSADAFTAEQIETMKKREWLKNAPVKTSTENKPQEGK